MDISSPDDMIVPVLSAAVLILVLTGGYRWATCPHYTENLCTHTRTEGAGGTTISNVETCREVLVWKDGRR